MVKQVSLYARQVVEILYDFRQPILFVFVVMVVGIFRIKDLIDGHDFSTVVKDVAIAVAAAQGVDSITDSVTTWKTPAAVEVAETPKVPTEDVDQ